MKISETIKQLQEIQKERGDIEVWTHGEYGANNSIRLTRTGIWSGIAMLAIDCDTLIGFTDKSEIICYIGDD